MKAWMYVLMAGLAWSACSPNNVELNENLGRHFDQQQLKGTFGMYDNGKGAFTIYNLQWFKDSALLPGGSFDLVNALVGLETGKISDENMLVQTAVVTGGADTGSATVGLSMEQAFRHPSTTYFEHAARLVGKDTLQRYLDTLGYGQRYGKTNIQKTDSFWLDNTLRVTADEQLGLVKQLYFDQLPFQKRTQRIVRQVMVKDNNANYKMAYKSGTALDSAGRQVTWVVGWIEENNHPYPFVINTLSHPGNNAAQKTLTALKNILAELEFFKGKK